MCMSHVARAQPNVNVCREAVCVTNGTCLSLCGLSLCAPRAFGCAGNARQPSARLARYKAELRVLYDDMFFASFLRRYLWGPHGRTGASYASRRDETKLERRSGDAVESPETGRQRRARPRGSWGLPSRPPPRRPRHPPPPRALSALGTPILFAQSELDRARRWVGLNIFEISARSATGTASPSPCPCHERRNFHTSSHRRTFSSCCHGANIARDPGPYAREHCDEAQRHRGHHRSCVEGQLLRRSVRTLRSDLARRASLHGAA